MDARYPLCRIVVHSAKANTRKPVLIASELQSTGWNSRASDSLAASDEVEE